MPKISITLKDTDAMYEAIQDHVTEELKASELAEDEQDAIRELRVEKYSEIIGKFFEYSEYLTVEVDTDSETARVVTASELYKARNG